MSLSILTLIVAYLLVGIFVLGLVMHAIEARAETSDLFLRMVLEDRMHRASMMIPKITVVLFWFIFLLLGWAISHYTQTTLPLDPPISGGFN